MYLLSVHEMRVRTVYIPTAHHFVIAGVISVDGLHKEAADAPVFDGLEIVAINAVWIVVRGY